MTRRTVKRFIKIWSAIGAIVIIAGYGAFRAKDLASGPEVSVISPADGSTFHESLVEIKGNVKNISHLTLNGDKIFTDESGIFDEKILLSNGYNKVTLEAQDRFGRTTSKTLQLIYK